MGYFCSNSTSILKAVDTSFQLKGYFHDQHGEEVLTPFTPTTSFLANSTNQLDMFIVV